MTGVLLSVSNDLMVAGRRKSFVSRHEAPGECLQGIDQTFLRRLV
jgi:hypothetical protein